MTLAIKLLVIEDSDSDFALLERELRRGERRVDCHRVQTPQALQLALQQAGWAALLSDYQVPGMRFEDSLVWATTRLPDVPVILVSGFIGEEKAIALLKLGMRDFVAKDNLGRLPSVLDRCLREAEERRRLNAVEESLRQSENQYRVLVEQAADAIVTTNSAGNIVNWNRGAEQMFGYKEEEAIGRAVAMLLPERFLERHRAGVARLFSGAAPRGAGKPVEGVALRQDGREFPIELSHALWSGGDERFITSIIRDISERKQAERQRKEHREQLEELVRLRTEELSSALEVAKLADQTKDEFLANISHELRTPLNAVIGMAGLAQAMSGDAKQRGYLDRIVASGKHLNRLIGDLLDLTKIAAGHMTFESITFSLRGLIERASSVMAPSAAEKGLGFGYSIDPAVPEVLIGDPLRVEQILLNLMSNAIKFTSAGRVELHVRLAGGDAQRVCLDLEVEDTGIGIKPEELERLFSPFSQADSSVSRKYGGTGLGLAISRRLAQMMDGDLSVSSRAGGGSTFRARICCGLGDAANLPLEQALAEGAMPQRYAGVTILIVEDQPINREIVEALLGAVGIRSRTATDGRQALELLLAAGPAGYDLVLMDIQMPIMDGLTATRALRSRNEFAALPIIGMTAHTMEHEQQIGLDAGMSDHIGKPFDNQTFYRTLAKWIPRAKQQEHLEPVAAAAAPSVAGLAALVGVDTQRGLARFAGNEQRYRHWLSKFTDDADATLNRLRQGLARGELEQGRRLAHGFKGQAGMLGLSELQALAAALEERLSRGEVAAPTLSRIEGELQLLRQRLQQVFGPVAASTGDPAVDGSERRHRLRLADKLILLIDDDPLVREVLDQRLQPRYQTRLAAAGAEGLALARALPRPDLILLDIELPDIQGYELCRVLKADAATAEIPLIFLSSHNKVIDVTRGLELGAVDYVAKPVEGPILLARIETHLRLRETSALLRNQNLNLESLVDLRTRDLAARTAELQHSQDLSIVALGSIAETRDNETGNHIYRTSAYVELLARRLATKASHRNSLAANDWEKIWKSAPLHDIGKVGIPDHILRKPGPLTAAEFEVMKRHTTLGRDAIKSAEIRASAKGSFLHTAAEIAYSHHERWDGSGYPDGLRGEEIPLSARLMAVADVYDALVSERVYKAAMPHLTAVDIIRAASGSQFDPGIVECFLELADELMLIALRFDDTARGAGSRPH